MAFWCRVCHSCGKLNAFGKFVFSWFYLVLQLNFLKLQLQRTPVNRVVGLEQHFMEISVQGGFRDCQTITQALIDPLIRPSHCACLRAPCFCRAIPHETRPVPSVLLDRPVRFFPVPSLQRDRPVPSREAAGDRPSPPRPVPSPTPIPSPSNKTRPVGPGRILIFRKFY